jgi:hypothetical protein
MVRFHEKKEVTEFQDSYLPKLEKKKYIDPQYYQHNMGRKNFYSKFRNQIRRKQGKEGEEKGEDETEEESMPDLIEAIETEPLDFGVAEEAKSEKKKDFTDLREGREEREAKKTKKMNIEMEIESEGEEEEAVAQPKLKREQTNETEATADTEIARYRKTRQKTRAEPEFTEEEEAEIKGYTNELKEGAPNEELISNAKEKATLFARAKKINKTQIDFIDAFLRYYNITEQDNEKNKDGSFKIASLKKIYKKNFLDEKF